MLDNNLTLFSKASLTRSQAHIIEKELERVINYKIERSVEEYNASGRNGFYYENVATIRGMLQIMTALTGKEYYFNERGMFEREDIKGGI